jgi:NTP pyrophosphatase (non-canonical NTP hydrolase)
MSTIRGWQKAAYAQSTKSGFHEGEEHLSAREKVAVFLINIHGEVSEAWEAFRGGDLFAPCDKAEKMASIGLHPLTCIEEELADIVIRCLDTAETFGIDLERAIEVKHAYNGTRAPKHGGKLA